MSRSILFSVAESPSGYNMCSLTLEQFLLVASEFTFITGILANGSQLSFVLIGGTFRNYLKSFASCICLQAHFRKLISLAVIHETTLLVSCENNSLWYAPESWTLLDSLKMLEHSIIVKELKWMKVSTLTGQYRSFVAPCVKGLLVSSNCSETLW